MFLESYWWLGLEVVFHPHFTADGGVWRIAFAFDPERRAVLLVAADKSGVAERRLYRRLIGKADERFDRHLDRLKAARRTR